MNKKIIRKSTSTFDHAIDMVADKWTLLIVRNLLSGDQTFSQLHDSSSKMATNILSNRLKSMLESKLIKRKRYQDNPVRYVYSLTVLGKELYTVVNAIEQWGEKLKL